jgi:hypothetical protein
MRDLDTYLSGKEKVAKVKRLMDSMETFIGKSLSHVYMWQISSEQILSRNGRSMSQDRRIAMRFSQVRSFIR